MIACRPRVCAHVKNVTSYGVLAESAPRPCPHAPLSVSFLQPRRFSSIIYTRVIRFDFFFLFRSLRVWHVDRSHHLPPVPLVRPLLSFPLETRPYAFIGLVTDRPAVCIIYIYIYDCAHVCCSSMYYNFQSACVHKLLRYVSRIRLRSDRFFNSRWPKSSRSIFKISISNNMTHVSYYFNNVWVSNFY